jgi:hypothetical protein
MSANRKANNHGRPERVLIPKLALENAVAALRAATRALCTEPLRVDECEQNAARLDEFIAQPAYKLQHRAPKGHAIVPKALLLEGAEGIEEGASEFEDAMSYCKVESDIDSLDAKSDRLRAVAGELRRYAR